MAWMQRATRESRYWVGKRFERLRGSATVERKAVRGILVAAQCGIGNLILLTPCLDAIRRHFSDARIEILLRDNSGRQILDRSGLVDRIVELEDRPGTQALLEVFPRPIDLLFVRFGVALPPLRRFSVLKHIRYRVGAEGYPWGASGNGWFFSVPSVARPAMHEIDLNNHMAAAAGAPGECLPKFPVIRVRAHHREEAAAALATLWPRGTRYVTLHPLSSRQEAWKRWPMASYVTLASRIAEQGLHVVVLGSSSERSELMAAFGGLGEFIRVLPGDLNLLSVAAVIEGSETLVSNDSCLMHLASGLRHPQVAILGPTDYDRTHPRTPESVVIRRPCACWRDGSESERRKRLEACPHRTCLTDTSPDEVWEALSRRIAGR